MSIEELNKVSAQPDNSEITSANQPQIVENQILEVEISETPSLQVEDEELEHLTYALDEQHEELADDLSKLNKLELVEILEKASKEFEFKQAGNLAKQVKARLESIFDEEEQAALETFLEDGNNKDDFEFKADALKQRYLDAYQHIQQKRMEHRLRIEDEKKKNLELKKQILEELRLITESDETIESMEKVKALQSEWRKIRSIPAEEADELWNKYRLYMDKFYDNHSINLELKELDRQKNLAFKIDLILKVDELKNEPSYGHALKLLNKYQEEFKHIGPVPKDSVEDIWQRFKKISDEVYALKIAEKEESNAERVKNLELKTALCEKLEQVANFPNTKPKEWIEKTQLVDSIFDEWKKIGHVPREDSDSIWTRFKESRNLFYKNKNIFFKELNKEKIDNLQLKEALCLKANELKESSDWLRTSNELIKLQAEWKKIGPVPEKNSEEVWQRFRLACDAFFNRKDEHFKSQKDEQAENLKIKNNIIENVKLLEGIENGDEVIQKLKEYQKEWNATGFVPIKFKDDLQKEFNAITDKLYKKFKRNPSEMNETQWQSHYEEIAAMPEGKKKLQFEERRLKDKIRLLRTEIETFENNMGFFSNSKSAGSLLAGMKEKMDKTSVLIQKLEKELKVIKAIL